jgi:hypothetical protein
VLIIGAGVAQIGVVVAPATTVASRFGLVDGSKLSYQAANYRCMQDDGMGNEGSE